MTKNKQTAKNVGCWGGDNKKINIETAAVFVGF